MVSPLCLRLSEPVSAIGSNHTVMGTSVQRCENPAKKAACTSEICSISGRAMDNVSTAPPPCLRHILGLCHNLKIN